MGASTLTPDSHAATNAREGSARTPIAVDPVRWPRRMTEAVHRVTELVVRHLRVSRCSVWLTHGQPPRIECLDSYSSVSARHSRLDTATNHERARLLRALASRNVIVEPGAETGAESAGEAKPHAAVQLPAGVSALLAVGLHRGGAVSGILIAEQTDGPCVWTEAQIRFMQTMAVVVGDITRGEEPARMERIDRYFVDGLPIVAYRCRLTERGWIVGDISEGAGKILGQPAVHFIGGSLDAMRRALREPDAPAAPGNPCDLPSELPTFEYRYSRVAANGAIRHFVEQGSVGIDPQSQQPTIDGVIVELTPTSAEFGPGRIEPDAAQQGTDLLSRMSHELRTPLNAILGFAQLLELDPDDRADRRREYLTQIRNAGRHLLDLITHTLELSRIDAGATPADPRPVYVSAIVGECLALVAPQAAAQGIVIVDHTIGYEHAQAHVDPRRLRQVLLNLLSNAVKYNRRGGSVVVDVTTAPENIHLRIADTGIGISEEQMTSLFQPFNRLGREGGAVEGAGLGLAITRSLVEAMRGSLSVSSRPEAGSCFELTLPRSAAVVR